MQGDTLSDIGLPALSEFGMNSMSKVGVELCDIWLGGFFGS